MCCVGKDHQLTSERISDQGVSWVGEAIESNEIALRLHKVGEVYWGIKGEHV